jgi:class 3 adenylate cyclase
LTFGVWGNPVSVAETLVALAQPGEILVDSAVAEQLGGEWSIGSTARLPGLDDDVVTHAITRHRSETDHS